MVLGLFIDSFFNKNNFVLYFLIIKLNKHIITKYAHGHTRFYLIIFVFELKFFLKLHSKVRLLFIYKIINFDVEIGWGHWRTGLG